MKKYKILIIILTIFYTSVLIIALNPNVDECYKNYYIDKKYDKNLYLINKFLYHKNIVTLNTKYDIKSDNFLFIKGWSKAEDNFIWTNGKKSEIWFYCNEKQLNNIKYLCLNFTTFGNKIIVIYLNGHNLYDNHINWKNKTLLVPIKNSLVNGINILTFFIPHASKPFWGFRDNRSLGLCLNYIEFI